MKKQNKKLVRKTKPHKKPTAKRSALLRRGRYVPALVISVFASFLWMQPYIASTFGSHRGVLAYATNVSPAGLLSSTNSHRASNGAAALRSNSLLSSAAQAKANHMVTNNYWSHVAPDGTQPWWFITNAGYQYISAGENLAYGFMTSSDTVTGWMNSASHRANMLNNAFTEVGFGMANSENYTGKGPQTVIVAMYGKPQATPAPAPVRPTTPVPPQTKPAETKKPETSPVEQQAPPTEESAPVEEVSQSNEDTEEETIAIANTETTATAAPTTVSRVQLLTGGSAVWSATLVILATLSVGLLWLIYKGFHIRQYIVAGERFIAHHLHLDLTIVSIVYLGVVLLNTTGTIR